MPMCDRLKNLLTLNRFPRASKYDARWILDNEMGPNALWLAESLSQVMPLSPGMRILDMGCGRGMTSIFFAKEFGVTVWANDLWIPARDVWKDVHAAGLENRVFPITAEAHALPYADAFFDAIVSLDSFHYYGTDDTYLRYFSRFLRPGGRIGIVVPGLVRELRPPLPPYLTRRRGRQPPWWDPTECWSFHTAPWWRRHWEHTGLVEVETCAMIKDGGKLWLRWEHALAAGKHSFSGFPADPTVLRADRGRYLGFVRMVAEKAEGGR
ncbi:MAG: methyltransferase domain-containing protein [Planctomycetes bacterium]|nr:methyltransferase domain-containing protein [Planctomycetota bacterium]